MKREDNNERNLAIANRMRDLRVELGMTHYEVAPLAGMDRSNYSHIERGFHVPGLRSIARIACALGCSISYLLGADERGTPPPFDENELRSMVGVSFARLREARKISMRRVAQLAGVGESSVHRLERGERMATLDVCERVAKAFDLQLHELFTDVRAGNPALSLAPRSPVEATAASEPEPEKSPRRLVSRRKVPITLTTTVYEACLKVSREDGDKLSEVVESAILRMLAERRRMAKEPA